MNLDQAKQTFVQESEELLQSMESILLQAEAGEWDDEAINSLFRCAHTIKGSAGLFGMDAVVDFTHGVESVLSRVREGRLELGEALLGLLLECRDHIALLLDAALHGSDAGGAAAAGAALRARLDAHLAEPAAKPGVPAENAAEPAVECCRGPVTAADAWHISLRFGADVFRNGMDPMSFIAFLQEVGRLANVETLFDGMPAATGMDAESCYLGFEVDLVTDRDKAALESVFDFVRDDCRIRMLPPHSALEEYIRLIEELPEDPMRLGEILVRGGALTARELEAALERQRRPATDAAPLEGGKRLGEILVEERLTPEPAVAAALEKQKRAEEKRLQDTRVLKVPADRLDALIDLVGELVIAGAGAAAVAQTAADPRMREATSILSRLVEEIRDTALRLRMVPIGETFSRFPRVVRDLAKELGKEIELSITGAETELDKSMVEHIGDPLMHLVRNAIDHGIERPDRRLEKGKPAKGVVRLHAYHDSGSIVVEVGDDGNGLDGERIRAKAVERGMIAAGQQLPDADLFQLILEPGFSTAQEVTNLSGRGVGMDVVKRNLEALRGSIEIESRPGLGTTMRLRMPLTLAIIDGFLVQVGTSSYVVPLDFVVECVELTPQAKREARGRNYLNLRGEVLPFVRLRELFETPGVASARENIVVVQYGGRRAGLVVDRLQGEFQAVIKPLSALFARVKGIGGSTILGTGEVALIIDVPGLVQAGAARDMDRTRLGAPV